MNLQRMAQVPNTRMAQVPNTFMPHAPAPYAAFKASVQWVLPSRWDLQL